MLSELMRSADLDQNEVSLLMNGALACLSIGTFASSWSETESRYAKGNALGLNTIVGHEGSHYKAACKVFNLTHYETFLGRFGMSLEREDDYSFILSFSRELVEKLANQSLPTIFFVPDSLRSHRDAMKTKSEMQAALESRTFLQNCIFVFGLYRVQPKKHRRLFRQYTDYDTNTGMIQSLKALT